MWTVRRLVADIRRLAENGDVASVDRALEAAFLEQVPIAVRQQLDVSFAEQMCVVLAGR